MRLRRFDSNGASASAPKHLVRSVALPDTELAMTLNLTDAQLKTIIGELFLFKDPMPVLPKPANTDNDSVATNLAARMKPIAADARFTAVSVGVVDFTADRMTPRVWLHKGDLPWRIASTGKIAVLLAAVQLRDDVRRVKATGLVSAADDFDNLFATIWLKSTNFRVREIAGKDGSPRVSTIFDLAKPIPDFIGADIAIDRPKLRGIGHLDKDWTGVPDLTFWERLWLMGTQSDNVAATSCISEIGVAYMKAVQRGYGLFDTARGMHMLLSAGYTGVVRKTRVSKSAGAPEYRALRNNESQYVNDEWFDLKKDPEKKKPSHSSTQPGSVAALTAYMIALMQDKLVDKDACDTIRAHLADERDDTEHGAVVRGVKSIATVAKAHAKVGVLGSLRCEWAYMESSGRKYAIVAEGIVPKRVGTPRFSAESQGQDLAKAIHNALA